MLTHPQIWFSWHTKAVKLLGARKFIGGYKPEVFPLRVNMKGGDIFMWNGERSVLGYEMKVLWFKEYKARYQILRLTSFFAMKTQAGVKVRHVSCLVLPFLFLSFFRNASRTDSPIVLIESTLTGCEQISCGREAIIRCSLLLDYSCSSLWLWI